MRVPQSKIIVGNGFSAIVDHECNSEGDVVYFTQSGKLIKWNTHKQWAGMTSMARGPLIQAHYEECGDPITSASVTCSICKKPAICASY